VVQSAFKSHSLQTLASGIQIAVSYKRNCDFLDIQYDKGESISIHVPHMISIIWGRLMSIRAFFIFSDKNLLFQQVFSCAFWFVHQAYLMHINPYPSDIFLPLLW